MISKLDVNSGFRQVPLSNKSKTSHHIYHTLWTQLFRILSTRLWDLDQDRALVNVKKDWLNPPSSHSTTHKYTYKSLCRCLLIWFNPEPCFCIKTAPV